MDRLLLGALGGIFRPCFYLVQLSLADFAAFSKARTWSHGTVIRHEDHREMIGRSSLSAAAGKNRHAFPSESLRNSTKAKLPGPRPIETPAVAVFRASPSASSQGLPAREVTKCKRIKSRLGLRDV